MKQFFKEAVKNVVMVVVIACGMTGGVWLVIQAMKWIQRDAILHHYEMERLKREQEAKP